VSYSYYVDNYRSGSPRNIRGPFATLSAAREQAGDVEIEVAPYDGVVEELSKCGSGPRLVESWSSNEDSEDYDSIYRVSNPQ